MATNLKFNERSLESVNLIPIELKGFRSENEAYHQAILQLRRNCRSFPGAKNGLMNAQKYLRKITATESENYSDDKEQDFIVTKTWGESHLLAMSFQAYATGWFRAWLVLTDASGSVLAEVTDQLIPCRQAPKGYVEFSLSEGLLNDINPLSDENCYVELSLKFQGRIKLTSRISAAIVNR